MAWQIRRDVRSVTFLVAQLLILMKREVGLCGSQPVCLALLHSGNMSQRDVVFLAAAAVARGMLDTWHFPQMVTAARHAFRAG